MERFYDGDQDQLFSEARVINPFRKPVIQRPKVSVTQAVWIVESNREISEID